LPVVVPWNIHRSAPERDYVDNVGSLARQRAETNRRPTRTRRRAYVAGLLLNAPS